MQNQNYELPDKTKVWVFAQNQLWREAGLGYHELLLYSVMCGRDKAKWKSRNIDLAGATGLSENTVAASKTKLCLAGLVEGEHPLHSPTFFNLRKEPSGTHWSSQYLYWESLVKAKGSILKISDVMVWSFLRAKLLVDYLPDNGWTFGKLSSYLAMDIKTVSAAIDRLLEHKLMFLKSEHLGIRLNLTNLQDTYFKSKGQRMASTGKSLVIWDEPVTLDDEPVSVILDDDEDVIDLEQKSEPPVTKFAPPETWEERLLRSFAQHGITGDVAEMLRNKFIEDKVPQFRIGIETEKYISDRDQFKGSSFRRMKNEKQS